MANYDGGGYWFLPPLRSHLPLLLLVPLPLEPRRCPPPDDGASCYTIREATVRERTQLEETCLAPDDVVLAVVDDADVEVVVLFITIIN